MSCRYREVFNINSVFRCDTTFEIIDKLWLTDTSYTNTALIKTPATEHPEFPGHMMMYFKKDQGTYRCLATEIDTDKPNLSNISIISHDMDHIMENGLTIIVSMAQSLV